MKFADYKAFEMTADAVEKDMENFDRIAKTADAMRLDHAQFEAWAKLHHYDLVRCSHEPYSAYRSDLTNAALAGWRGANGETPQAKDDERALNGIPATHRHGEGAIARCFYCGRYSIDPKTLSDRQPKCDCGERHGWSGSFVKPGPDAKWSGDAPQAAAPQVKFECAARKQGSVGGNAPADCDWPGCGCDEHANRVIAALEESGALATAPQANHYQQLLGVAYVVLGCLVANGVDIPERFLDAFSDPDSVENPLELLPCDFSPARAVRAAVEAEDAARVTKLRELLRTKRVADEEIDAWLNPEVDRRSVWFMYDCHQFARPDVSNPEAAFKSARELFDEDGCGSIFVKRWKDGPAIRELELGADYKRNGYKVLDEEIRAWVERYFSWKPDAAQQESTC